MKRFFIRIPVTAYLCAHVDASDEQEARDQYEEVVKSGDYIVTEIDLDGTIQTRESA